MYIHEVIIDGFKSYAQRTVVSGFDPQFNAITGLNGTGKSNILDAICFVLGISNLSQVRVGNLQELVYKQGQAGVTKASVTVVFNNSDTSTSPVGYESHKQITVTRQVVIGGKNKYMINGHTVQQSQVQNLFHSVQLNVNNPHFLIMQGRITKVLNMKPEETLSMIEEAAGTRMFETKKQAALKTIEKKQLKVEELSKCMDQEITPTLESLRGERSNYITWQSNNSELERLERLCVAHEYSTCEGQVKSSEDDKQVIVNEMNDLQVLLDSKQAEADANVVKAKELSAKRESENEGIFQELKKTESDYSKELVKISTLSNNHKETLTTEKDAVVALQSQIDSVTKNMKAKEADLIVCNQDLSLKEAEAATAEHTAITLREKYQNACAGMADESNADLLSLPEQVAMWEKKVTTTLSQQQQGQLRSTHLKGSLKALKKASKEQEASHSKILKETDALRKQIQSIESKLGVNATAEANESTMRNKSIDLRRIITTLKDQVASLTAQLEARLSFEFKDPVKGFDRTRVKGLVAKLVRVNDKKAASALEITAGAKLYQVIVDTEDTGKLLLQKGDLKKRVTILPLNKISSRCTDASKLSTAKTIATSRGGSACLALELVGYDEDVKKAMEYVFGNTIICDKPEIAKMIAFDKSIRNKTVTLDGDVYDPSGTLTGGSKSSIGVLLSKIDDLAAAQHDLDSKMNEYNGIESALHDIDVTASANKDMTKELELKRHMLVMLQDKISDSTYSQSMKDMESMEQQLVTLDKELVALKAAHDTANDELQKLKSLEANNKKQREKAMKDIENHMKTSQKTSAAIKAEVTVIRNKRDGIAAEIQAYARDLSSINEQAGISARAVTKLEMEGDALSIQLIQVRSNYDDAKDAVVTKQKELNDASKEIKALEANKDKCLKAVQQASLDIRKIQHKLKQWEKECRDAANSIKTLLKSHPWIEKERQYFGTPNSDYDFTAKDVTGSKKRLHDMKANQDKLARKINKKVMGMIEKAESEYEELARKKQVILNDKAKIEAVIDELDIKKEQALQTTWMKVNHDFGSIFSTLLPGTTAKLEPPENCTVADGLTVRVAFNGIWKDSLTELSGGQRSLLALSLILALLLFKPAPMYILDEVDAALDLSHTQNIGLMLRTHFSTSQFIVVSLKEGMFNNANVIFRTKFVDGISAVTRTVVGGKSRPATNATLAVRDDEYSNDNENENSNAVAPPQKKGRGTTTKGASSKVSELIEA